VFLDPDRTPYDLNWRMFGIPVRVHPLFWLVSLIMGWDWLQLGFQYLLMWVAAVFVSILVHELGHVFMGRLFGSQGHIVLYCFGGLAIGSSTLHNRWQRIAVYLAGPLAGFVLFGLACWGLYSFDPDHVMPFAWRTLRFLYWINLFWGFLNLVPIWPLDGGQVSREIFMWLLPSRGLRNSLGLSVLCAGLLALYSLWDTYAPQPLLPFLDLSGLWYVLFFGMLAYYSYQLLQLETRRRTWEYQHDYWDR
jgi:Zn-dependent protease